MFHTSHRQISLGDRLYRLGEAQHVAEAVITIKRCAKLVISDRYLWVHRVDSLIVLNNLNQRVANNINNAVVNTDRHILHAVISNSHINHRHS